MRTLCNALVVLSLAVGCGSGTDLQDDPKLSPDLTELTFGGTFQSVVYVDTAPQMTLQLKNNGKADLVISSITVDGTDAALFTASPSGPSCPTGLTNCKAASLETIFVLVTYSPVAAGKHTANLVIASNTSSYDIQRQDGVTLKVGPTTSIPMTPTAVWKYSTAGKITDAADKALASIKVTCVKPLASTNPDSHWKGWAVTTAADGAFKQDYSWACAELLAEDTAAAPVYASSFAAFNPVDNGGKLTFNPTLKLSPVYKVSGTVKDDAAAPAPIDGAKVSCVMPPGAAQSWVGWDMTTAADGKFAKTALWPCDGRAGLGLVAEKTGFLAAHGDFKPGQDVTITMKK